MLKIVSLFPYLIRFTVFYCSPFFVNSFFVGFVLWRLGWIPTKISVYVHVMYALLMCKKKHLQKAEKKK